MRALAATIALGCAVLCGGVTAQDAPSFHREVQPLLRERCAGCHRPDKQKGDVDLSDYAAVMRGVEDEVGILAVGDPSGSVLLDVVVAGADGALPEMPKEGDPLSAGEVDLLRRWIAAGAVDDTPESERGPALPERPPVYRSAPVIPSLAWSPDGRWLAVPGRHEVLVHDMSGGTAPRRLLGRAERIEAVEFSADGVRLAAVGGAPGRFGEVQVWRVADGALLLSKIVTHDCLFGVSWSPDGRLLAFGATDRAVRGIDAESGEQVLFQGAHDDWVLDTTFSTDGSHLVSVGRDRSMKLIKVDSQQFIDNITSITPGALKGGLIAVARHPARDELLVGGADGAPGLFRMFREKKRVIGDDFNRIRSFEGLEGRVFDVAFVGDGARIVVASSHATGGEARMYQVEDGAELWRRATPRGLYAVAPSPDGAQVAVAGFAGEVEVLDGGSGEVQRRFVPVPLERASTEDTR